MMMKNETDLINDENFYDQFDQGEFPNHIFVEVDGEKIDPHTKQTIDDAFENKKFNHTFFEILNTKEVANYLYLMNKIQAYRNDYRGIKSQKDDPVNVLITLAHKFSNAGNTSSALILFLVAASIEPDNISIYQNRYPILYKMGDFKNTIKDIEQIFHINNKLECLEYDELNMLNKFSGDVVIKLKELESKENFQDPLEL